MQDVVRVSRNSREFEMVVLSDNNTLEFVDSQDAFNVPDRIAKQLTSIEVCLINNWIILD